MKEVKKMRIEEQLGLRIRYLRKQRKLSIEDLAIMSDINRNYLGDLERGLRNPTIRVLEKICNGLDITLSELVRGLQTFEK